MVEVAYISPPVCLEHLTGPGHPERPARLDSINRKLQASGLHADLHVLDARAAVENEIVAAHGRNHVARVVSLIQAGVSCLDGGDTTVSSKSLEAAWLAAGSALTGVEQLQKGTFSRIFCGVRPPGHHAESNRAMGFCVFNNVAVAAAYALKQGVAQRVLILDWDVHHGNGTQEIFEHSNQVFYYSMHQYPFYPGTGNADEVGSGPGRGFTLNRPLSGGSGDLEYLRLLEKDLKYIAETFKPDLILISAGFDAHNQDPLGGMRLTTDGFAQMTQLVVDMANHCCEGKIISLLEGGYDLDALADSVSVHLQTLMQ